MGSSRGPYRTGRERAARILDAAHALFIENGYRATSLRDVAAASGISHPALLRHFGSREEILTALIGRLDTAYGDWSVERTDGAVLAAAGIARRNETVFGWIELFTALLGEATSPDHPGHELMRRRRAVGLTLGTQLLLPLSTDERSASFAALRLGALWDGLQILSLYFPGEIDIPGQLAAHESELAHSGVPKAPAETGDPVTCPAAPAIDPDSRRRALEAAARRYARQGYHEASMQSIADDAGLTKAALVHIARTKRDLLDAVLTEVIDAPRPEGEDSAQWLYSLPQRPRWVTAADVVLMCEATVPAHPAHAFMTRRLAEARQSAASALATTGLPPAQAASEADRIVSIGLGVVISWLYDPDHVDPRALLGDALARIPSFTRSQ
ncbi:TetR family transcriptional regulator [Streptomyces sp. NPDC057565]|uniref:TetR/AcrR family transcriptional regulator n=1 Tax=Streptomyces sp. NPDC057565 TaxID=3346169 RepID=UPI0036B3C415